MKIKVSQLREAIRIAIKDILKESENRVRRHKDRYGDDLEEANTPDWVKDQQGLGEDHSSDDEEVEDPTYQNIGSYKTKKSASANKLLTPFDPANPESLWDQLDDPYHETSDDAFSPDDYEKLQKKLGNVKKKLNMEDRTNREVDQGNVEDLGGDSEALKFHEAFGDGGLDDQKVGLGKPDPKRLALAKGAMGSTNANQLGAMGIGSAGPDQEGEQDFSDLGEAKLCEDGCLGCVLCQNGPVDHEVNHLKDVESDGDGLSVMATIKSESKKKVRK